MGREIEAVVRDYLDGMCFADEEKLRRAFHSDARLIGYYRGVFEWDTVDKFVADCRSAGGLPVGSTYHWKILQIDRTETVAVVKVEDDYLGTRFTDYLTLMQVDGAWKIVNKAFHNHV